MTKATKIEGLDRFLCVCWQTFTVEVYDEEWSKGLRERVMGVGQKGEKAVNGYKKV